MSMTNKRIACCKCAEHIATEFRYQAPQPYTKYTGPIPTRWRDLRDKYFDDPAAETFDLKLVD